MIFEEAAKQYIRQERDWRVCKSLRSLIPDQEELLTKIGHLPGSWLEFSSCCPLKNWTEPAACWKTHEHFQLRD